ncbi:unnamed protein product [Clonostachys rosea]|uniref:Uncharacterized protein n=1 Tax=Bionectria ochroleuca TaxID=29856 RepID=A0ABY6UHT8_BIOOC|nr:unnamed protein product [Clonostachys rosea]
MWEIVWMASPTLVLLLLFMPETSSATILLRRACRLRKLTGNETLQSQSEIDQRHIKASDIVFSALIRPMEIMLKDPSIFFVNLYTGYFYGVFYTFFEVFPLIFPVFYGFSLGETGLTFLSCFIGVIIGISAYFVYYMVPDNIKNGFREQEHRLVPAIIGSVLLPIGLFIFAWTSRSSIHWVVPLVGVVIFVMVFGDQAMLAVPLYSLGPRINLGVDKGVTVLADLSVAGIFGTAAIYIFGKKLRARSKFAES